MQASPTVSVVMCTYNGAAFLDEQVQSIVTQDYPFLELVVCDDQSTDDTWQKLLAWQQRDSRIKPHRNPVNLGYNKNFEQALQLATGSLVAIADQDDIWLPQKIGRQVQAMANEQVMLSHTRSVRLQQGRLRYKSARLNHHFAGSDTRRLFMFNQVNGHDMMVRQSLLQYALPLPNDMMYDWWLAVMATCYGTIAPVDEFLVHHRIHQGNSYFTNNTARQKQPDLLWFLDQFAAITVLPAHAREFLNQLRQHIRDHGQHPAGKLDKTFFHFLFANAPILFGHKKRRLKKFYYFKTALKYARLHFEGKGIL